jgi:hypothetical protein
VGSEHDGQPSFGSRADDISQTNAWIYKSRLPKEYRHKAKTKFKQNTVADITTWK